LATDGLPALRGFQPPGQDGIVDLSGQGLTVLPPWVSERTGLQEVNLTRNRLTALPPEIGQLTSLRRLWLDSNQLTALPPQIGQLTNLRELGLGRNRLTALPPDIGQLASLEELSASGNQLTALPPQIGQLTGLRELWLDGNQLTELPPEIPGITGLEVLGLDGNQLTVLPPQIGQLTNLRVLSLDGNQLTVLPPQIGQLTNLRVLSLDGNQLTVLPPQIGQLTNLQVLSLDGNQLTVLPPQIGQLGNLKVLGLEENRLTTLPHQLADLVIGDLQLGHAGNPLREPFPELIEQSKEAFATYLRSLDGALPQYEAKVLLVGEGNVGKTSLVAALLNAPFVDGRSTTHGIEIQLLTMRHPDLDVDMIIRAWDFGGQDVYRITHQFFFSRRALYLVVWNPREGHEQNEVDRWLRRIRLRVSQDARALIVATHCDERRPELDYLQLRKSNPELLADRYEVDNKSGHGISELRTGIAAEAARLPQMGQLISSRWIAARDEILACSRTEPLMHRERFTEICQRHRVDDGEIITLSDLMHELGQIVYYASDEGLRDYVILNPEWLAKAISYVLEDNSTRQAGGILDHARLAVIWQDQPGGPAYPARYHPYFLRLMEKFDISYRLEDGNHSLIAQLVPYERPDLPWDARGPLPGGFRSLTLVYQFTEQAPGLIAWLTVRQQHASTGKHWRSGVFLRHPMSAYSSEALIELQTPDLLTLDVRAPSPDHFFHVLDDSIEELIRRRWPNLVYSRFVPCPKPATDGLRCAGRFPLEYLQGARQDGTTHAPCQVCRTQWDISELLTGFARPELPLQHQLQTMRNQLAAVQGQLAHVADVTKRTEIGVSHLQSMATEAADSMRRLLKAADSEITDCPRLFTLTPESPPFSRRLRFYQRYYQLILWCEHPGHWHPWPTASYSLEQPRDWLISVAPYVTLVLAGLRTVAPIAAAAAEVAMPARQFEHAKPQLELMESLIEALPGQLIKDQPQFVNADGLTQAEGEAARALRAVLFEHDRVRAFGGLRRVWSPSGDFLWVCTDHYPEYDPGLPRFPGSPS
jgi:internalin A